MLFRLDNEVLEFGIVTLSLFEGANYHAKKYDLEGTCLPTRFRLHDRHCS